MKIWACISVFNNADYLRAVIESIQFVDHVVLVDGKYQAYPGEYHYSTDGTIDIITRFVHLDPDKFKFIPARNWDTQVQKRNAYMSIVPAGDWILVIDADEIFHGDGDILRQAIQRSPDSYKHQIRIYNTPNEYQDRNRLFQKTTDMKYKRYHFNIVDSNGRIVNTIWDNQILKISNPLEGVCMYHMKLQRDQSVVLDKLDFYKKRMAEEFPWIFADLREYLAKHNLVDPELIVSIDPRYFDRNSTVETD